MLLIILYNIFMIFAASTSSSSASTTPVSADLGLGIFSNDLLFDKGDIGELFQQSVSHMCFLVYI